LKGSREAWEAPIGTIVVALLLVILFLLFLLLRRRSHPVPPAPIPPPAPPGAIPNKFDEPTLATTLGMRLIGTPANGTRSTPSASTTALPVIWVDGGDEVLVHLESMRTKLLNGVLLVSVDLETDQTGRTPLVVRLATATSGQAAGLVAMTDEFPSGNAILAARWGTILQSAVWAALLGLAKDHAAQTGQAPRGIGVTAGQLSLQPGAPLTAGISS
jgi:hypothetical protein